MARLESQFLSDCKAAQNDITRLPGVLTGSSEYIGSKLSVISALHAVRACSITNPSLVFDMGGVEFTSLMLKEYPEDLEIVRLSVSCLERILKESKRQIQISGPDSDRITEILQWCADPDVVRNICNILRVLCRSSMHRDRAARLGHAHLVSHAMQSQMRSLLVLRSACSFLVQIAPSVVVFASQATSTIPFSLPEKGKRKGVCYEPLCCLFISALRALRCFPRDAGLGSAVFGLLAVIPRAAGLCTALVHADAIHLVLGLLRNLPADDRQGAFLEVSLLVDLLQLSKVDLSDHLCAECDVEPLLRLMRTMGSSHPDLMANLISALCILCKHGYTSVQLLNGSAAETVLSTLQTFSADGQDLADSILRDTAEICLVVCHTAFTAPSVEARFRLEESLCLSNARFTLSAELLRVLMEKNMLDGAAERRGSFGEVTSPKFDDTKKRLCSVCLGKKHDVCGRFFCIDSPILPVVVPCLSEFAATLCKGAVTHKCTQYPAITKVIRAAIQCYNPSNPKPRSGRRRGSVSALSVATAALVEALCSVLCQTSVGAIVQALSVDLATAMVAAKLLNSPPKDFSNAPRLISVLTKVAEVVPGMRIAIKKSESAEAEPPPTVEEQEAPLDGRVFTPSVVLPPFPTEPLIIDCPTLPERCHDPAARVDVVVEEAKRVLSRDQALLLPRRVVYSNPHGYGATHSRMMIIPPYSVSSRQMELSRKLWGEDCLCFHSNFESGNLYQAVQVGPTEYDLFLRPDIHTRGYMQWFFFAIRNIRYALPEGVLGSPADGSPVAKPGVRSIQFNIINHCKSNSLFNEGMRPLLYSYRRARVERCGWRRCGRRIGYFANGFKNEARQGVRDDSYYTLTFTVDFDITTDDTCLLAHSFPYSTADYARDICRILDLPRIHSILRRETLCVTASGSECDVLTITDYTADAEEIRQRKGVFLTARVHPGETAGSWMMRGVLRTLTARTAEADLLRKTFFFKLIPILNPDGVKMGNSRCGFEGEDLNRKWKTPERLRHPTVHYAKILLKQMAAARDVVMYCDLHAHSRSKNIFMYGVQPIKRRAAASMRVIPLLCGTNRYSQDYFSYEGCNFGLPRARKTTARAVAAQEIGIKNSYTMEASFCGPDFGALSGFHYSHADFERMGKGLLDVVQSIHHPDPTMRVDISSVIDEILLELRQLAVEGLEAETASIGSGSIKAEIAAEKPVEAPKERLVRLKKRKSKTRTRRAEAEEELKGEASPREPPRCDIDGKPPKMKRRGSKRRVKDFASGSEADECAQPPPVRTSNTDAKTRRKPPRHDSPAFCVLDDSEETLSSNRRRFCAKHSESGSEADEPDPLPTVTFDSQKKLKRPRPMQPRQPPPIGQSYSVSLARAGNPPQAGKDDAWTFEVLNGMALSPSPPGGQRKASSPIDVRTSEEEDQLRRPAAPLRGGGTRLAVVDEVTPPKFCLTHAKERRRRPSSPEQGSQIVQQWYRHHNPKIRPNSASTLQLAAFRALTPPSGSFEPVPMPRKNSTLSEAGTGRRFRNSADFALPLARPRSVDRTAGKRVVFGEFAQSPLSEAVESWEQPSRTESPRIARRARSTSGRIGGSFDIPRRKLRVPQSGMHVSSFSGSRGFSTRESLEEYDRPDSPAPEERQALKKKKKKASKKADREEPAKCVPKASHLSEYGATKEVRWTSKRGLPVSKTAKNKRLAKSKHLHGTPRPSEAADPRAEVKKKKKKAKVRRKQLVPTSSALSKLFV